MTIKRWAIGIFLFLLCVNGADAKDPAVAKVNGKEISNTDLQRYMAEKLPYLSFHSNMSEEKMKALRAEAIQELIDKELFYRAAEKNGVKADEKAVAEKLEKIRTSFKTEKEFQTALEKAGMSEQGLTDQLSRESMVQRYLDAEVIKKAEISDEDLAANYQANKEKYFAPERLKLREIFFKVPPDATKEEKAAKKAKAEEILNRAKKGEDFGLLAWEFSEDNYKYKSGDVGYMHRDMLLTEIDQALTQVSPGQTTGLIETIYGYYIFYLDSKLPTRQLLFEEVKDKLRKEIQQGREKDLKAKLIADLRSRAEISIP